MMITAPKVSTGSGRRLSSVSLYSKLSLITVLCSLVILDLLTFSARVMCTLETAQQILDGYTLEKTYSNTYSK